MSVAVDSELASHRAKSVLGRVVDHYPQRDFAVRFWDGNMIERAPGEPVNFTLHVNQPSTARTLLSHPEFMTLAEAYVHNELDIEGDVFAAFRLAEYLSMLKLSALERLGLAAQVLMLPKGRQNQSRSDVHTATLGGDVGSKRRVREAVTFHYNLPVEFFAAWLGETMAYSCAYFRGEEDSLDTAQRQKFDLICRKLELRPGQRLFDLGCGWGGFALHAAKYYGAEVYGITLSEPQAQFAWKRITAAGLSDQCRIEVRDFRDVRGGGDFDRIASIGAIEHVPLNILPQYFSKCIDLLKPGGRMLNQGITTCTGAALPDGPSFKEKYIFPDTEFLPISTVLTTAEQSGLEIRDVECLREHYALTLRNWLANFERNSKVVKAITNEEQYRIFRLYLASSALQFQRGALSLFQTLLVKPDAGNSGMPLTREAWGLA